MIKQGKAKLLYLAHEALLKANVLELLATVEVVCLAVDEAHCIPQGVMIFGRSTGAVD